MALLVAMFLFTTADVVLRYFFNKPILGGLEITAYALQLTVFSGIAFTQVQKGHIRVETFFSRFPLRVQNIIESVTYFMCIALVFLLAWQSFMQMQYFLKLGQYTHTLTIPVWPFPLAISIGAALLGLVLISDLIKSWIRVLERHKWDILISLVLGPVLATAPLWVHEIPFQVTPTTAGVLGFILLLVLLFSGMPIAFVMFLVGIIGMSYLNGTDAGIAMLRRTPYLASASYTFAVLPMFMLMGSFAYHSGLTDDLFNTVNKWLGHVSGGLGVATIGAAAGFAAVCGSSLAATATMATVALPELRKHKYDAGLASGCILAGGTLGPLIPPSTILIIYGLIAEQPVGTLFIAGIIPGIVLTLFFMLAVYSRTKINPKLGPPAPKSSFKEKVGSLKGTWATIALFALVMGGIYFGIFTPTEAGGIGAFGALVLIIGKRKLNAKNLKDSVDDALRMSSMAMFLFIGAMVIGFFLSLSRLPFNLADYLTSLTINRYIIFAGIIVMYLILGCIMECFALMVITVPIVLPIVMALGFSPIWFGVLMVIVVEMGLLTPPVGFNVFLLKSIARDIPIGVMFRGIWLFFACMLVVVILMTAFPEISLWLVEYMR